MSSSDYRMRYEVVQKMIRIMRHIKTAGGVRLYGCLVGGGWN